MTRSLSYGPSPDCFNISSRGLTLKTRARPSTPGMMTAALCRPISFEPGRLGSNGPYNLRLLIQPGPPGHILGVVDITKVHLHEPGFPSSGQPIASRPPTISQPPAPPAYQPPANQPPAAIAPPPAPAAQQPEEPTADTPSGPIMGSGSPAPANSSGQPSLAPPPDPAPSGQ